MSVGAQFPTTCVSLIVNILQTNTKELTVLETVNKTVASTPSVKQEYEAKKIFGHKFTLVLKLFTVQSLAAGSDAAHLQKQSRIFD